jgi:hypothetical protein
MDNRLLTLLPFAASGLLLILALSAPAVAGDDKDFGNSVNRNIEAQTVDMNPQYEGKLMEGGVGRRSARAVNRYMTDRIRPLIQLNSKSQVGSQGGSTSVSAVPDSAGGN